MQPLLHELNAMWLSLVHAIPNIALAFTMLLVTWTIAAVARRILAGVLRRARLRPSLEAFVLTMANVSIWIIGILVALTIIFPSLTPAKLLATIGLGSVAVGLAFRDVFENFLAGALIMLRKPMRIGDYIECDEVEGKIEQITIRDTYVRKLDDVLVLVPNSYLYKNPVFVNTDRATRRFEVVCGVAYGEDVDNARELIREAVKTVQDIDHDRPIEVYASEFNASSIDFTVRWWGDSMPPGSLRSRDQVIRSIKRALDEAGIEIPFPQRTLTFADPLKVHNAPLSTNEDT